MSHVLPREVARCTTKWDVLGELPGLDRDLLLETLVDDPNRGDTAIIDDEGVAAIWAGDGSNTRTMMVTEDHISPDSRGKMYTAVYIDEIELLKGAWSGGLRAFKAIVEELKKQLIILWRP